MPRPVAVRPARRMVLRAKSRAYVLSSDLRARMTEPVVALEGVRRRLELFLAGLYGHQIPIEAVDAPATAGWFRRHVLWLPDKQTASDALPTTDGARIYLPHALGAHEG